MAYSLPRSRQIEVLHHVLEGCTLRSAARLTGVHRTTIMNLLLRFGAGCQRLMDEQLTGLTLRHVEVDEIWTFVAKKQAHLTVDERAERYDVGDMFLWTCIDADTKLIATHLVGKRSADNARRLMVDLAKRLNFPSPGSGDDHAYVKGEYKPIVQISTDGLAAYPEAVDLAFGPFADHGVIIKQYRNAGMKYDPSEIVGTERRVVRGQISEWSIVTSHVERHNLTIRTLLKRFTRLSLGFSKKLDNLIAAVQAFMAYYNFVWRTRYPDNSGQRGRLRPPAAMMAGVTDRLWRFDDLFDAAM